MTVSRRAAPLEAAEDPFGPIRATVADLVPQARLAEVIAYEASVVYGGLLSWWMKPPQPGASRFAFHRRDAYASVVLGLLMVLAIELFPVHLLIARWHPVAAWIVTGLSIYGAVWMIADLQAMRLRPIRLTLRALELRIGLRWEVGIPLETIARVERITPGAPGAGKRGLKAVPFGQPTHRLTTVEPVIARGPYGFGRRVTTIDFGVDEPRRFDERLALLGVSGPDGGGARGGTTSRNGR